MGFSFGKKYNRSRKFTADIEDCKGNYTSFKDLYNKNGKDAVYKIKGIYINKAGEEIAPLFAIDGTYVNVPPHYMDTINELLDDVEAIEAINNGKCGFSIYPYTNKYTKEGEFFYSFNFIDLD